MRECKFRLLVTDVIVLEYCDWNALLTHFIFISDGANAF